MMNKCDLDGNLGTNVVVFWDRGMSDPFLMIKQFSSGTVEQMLLGAIDNCTFPGPVLWRLMERGTLWALLEDVT